MTLYSSLSESESESTLFALIIAFNLLMLFEDLLIFLDDIKSLLSMGDAYCIKLEFIYLHNNIDFIFSCYILL
jgi:hypothetical protein